MSLEENLIVLSLCHGDCLESSQSLCETSNLVMKNSDPYDGGSSLR